MSYLIDTNICIYLMKNRPPQLMQRFEAFKLNDIKISSITVAELQFGVAKSTRRAHNQKVLEAFLIPFDVIPFTEQHTLAYGTIRATLQRTGKIIGPMDLLIAAHALAENHTLVTNNIKEFKRVAGLQVENWIS